MYTCVNHTKAKLYLHVNLIHTEYLIKLMNELKHELKINLKL